MNTTQKIYLHIIQELEASGKTHNDVVRKFFDKDKISTSKEWINALHQGKCMIIEDTSIYKDTNPAEYESYKKLDIDGYSLEAQKNRIKAFADYSHFNIVHEYEDTGKSGKSIDGRIEFQTMLNDIMLGKDKVSFVLVYKLSRFGRNAADVLSTLQIIQDYGVNLICVEDGIDSLKDAGKLMISVLSAVAEIERENIRIQTMEGRIQKARDGKWNGGFVRYGYKIVDGNLEINEEEAEAIKMIFDLYANTDMGANGVAKYLENHSIRKIARQNGKYPFFSPHLIRQIINNPVYNGKIAYGRRKTEKVHGTRNEYKQVKSDDYLLVDALHEPLVDDELWNKTQLKINA